MTVWEILNSKFSLLIGGFVLTTIVGKYLTTFLQRKSWERQTKIDLYQKKYDNGTKFLDELSKLIGTRFFLLQKLLWAIEDENQERIEKVEKDYFAVVHSWNSEYYMNRNKVRLLVSDEMANYFLDYADDRNPQKPKSLHYKFVFTHRIVMGAKGNKSKLGDARLAVNQLNWKCSTFLEHLTTDFAIRAEKLNLLDTSIIKGKSKQNLEKENVL